MTELLQSHDKALIDEELLLTGKWFLDMESTPGEEVMKTIETIRKDLEYFTYLVDKAIAGFERTDSNFERNSTVGKMLSNSITSY